MSSSQQQKHLKEGGEAKAKPDGCSSSSSTRIDDSCGITSSSLIASFSNARKRCRISPLPNDIVFGRGKPSQDHPGNRIMLEITTKHKERYFATHRALRRTIAEQVLDIVLATGARFLKREEKEGDEYWEEVSRSVAYDKVSHALRNKKCRMPGDKLRRIKPRYRSNESQCNQSRRNVPDLTQGVDTLVFRRDPNLASLSGSNMLPPSVLQPSILNHQILAAGLMPGLAAPLLSSPPLLSPLLLHPGFVGSSLDSTYAHGLPRSQLNRYDSLDRLIRARMVESLLRESDQPDFRHLGSGGG